jgi:transposase
MDQVTIDELWDELTARLHHHNEYGPSGCPRCRRREAELVAARMTANNE